VLGEQINLMTAYHFFEIAALKQGNAHHYAHQRAAAHRSYRPESNFDREKR